MNFFRAVVFKAGCNTGYRSLLQVTLRSQIKRYSLALTPSGCAEARVLARVAPPCIRNTVAVSCICKNLKSAIGLINDEFKPAICLIRSTLNCEGGHDRR